MTVVLILSVTCAIAAHAQGHASEAVLYVGCLNADCRLDTVIGWMDEELHYLPHFIRWGAGAEDSCASETPKKNRVTETEIIYPDWKRITGSVSFEQLNDDSLVDMMLYIWGHTTDNGNQKRDTLRPLVLFGQVSLDGVKEIKLGQIGKFQAEPYFAMELSRDVDLRDPKVRDVSGRPSYELKRVVLDVKKPKDTVKGPEAPPIAGIESQRAMAVRIYPNPTSLSTNIEAAPIAPGEYTVEVVAVNGTVALEQRITVTESRSLLSSLDVSGLASGYYALRLYTAQRQIGTYPIIITR